MAVRTCAFSSSLLLAALIPFLMPVGSAKTAASQALSGSQPLPTSAEPGCPVTIPNGNVPPYNPFPNASLHHGNGALWTVLTPDGVLRADSHITQPDGSIRMKFMWWRAGEGAGPLSIEGHRLDASAPPAIASILSGYYDNGFQASSITFPTEGCWEITGKAGTSSLTFVLFVVKVPDRATPEPILPVDTPVLPTQTVPLLPTAAPPVTVEPVATATPTATAGIPNTGRPDFGWLIAIVLLSLCLLGAGAWVALMCSRAPNT
jgi:hypothetical protein